MSPEPPPPPRRLCWRAAVLGLCLPLLPWPATAQLRSIVVPEESGVVIAPRSRPAPRLAAPPRALPMVAAVPVVTTEPPAPVQLPAGPGLLGAPLVGMVLPALAGALLGGTLAGGGGGGGGGPVRTR